MFLQFFWDSLGAVSFASWGTDADRDADVALGLKLGAELGAPGWTLHVIMGLVCWWVLILGVQVMRVAKKLKYFCIIEN
ncbi:hypothetical protein Hanom_Chr02g00144941 [Helianthus anomalus]